MTRPVLLPFVLALACANSESAATDAGSGGTAGAAGAGGAAGIAGTTGSAGSASAGAGAVGGSAAGSIGSADAGGGTAGSGGAGAAGVAGTGGGAGGGGAVGGSAGGGIGNGGMAGSAGAAGTTTGSAGTGGASPQDVTAHLDQLKRSFGELQFGLFHHFGILTYTGSWAQGNLPIDQFNPGSTLDARQWAKAAKAAGAKFGVLTTRHHDGFALWPSKASTFNVGHISWMNGQGDVVKNFVDGYRAEGLLPAFYYSIWDTTFPVQGNLTAGMVQYLTTQLTELMTNYGPIPLLIFDGWSWMMGHHSAEAAYIHNLVKSLQPDILILDHEGMNDPFDVDLVMYEEPRGVFTPAGNTWAAAQDQKINKSGGNDWFWKSNIGGYLTVSNIVDSHINMLVPRHSTFILNCPPNSMGLLDDTVVTLLGQVGTYRTSHPVTTPMLASGGPQNSNPYFPVAATASSGTAASAIDGSNDLGKYADWRATGGTPQWVQIDLGSTKTAGFLGYLPPYIAGSAFNTSTGKCTGTPCAFADSIGLVTSYEIDVSANGTAFTSVASGTWPADGKMHGVAFPATPARYIRFIATGVNSGNAAANEIVVGGPQSLTLKTPAPADFGH